MDDCINRKSVYDALCKICNERDVCEHTGQEGCHKVFAQIPDADVRENVRGKWIHTDAFPHKVYCSVCFNTYLQNEKWAAELPITLHPNFCPNCGADMRGSK